MFYLCLFFLALLIGSFVAEMLAIWMQVLRLLSSPLPHHKGTFSEEQYEQARLYTIDKIALAAIRRTCSFLCLILILRYLLLFKLDSLLRGTFPEASETFFSSLFVAIFFFLESLLNAPFDLLSRILIDRKHGVSKESPLDSLADNARTILISSGCTFPVGYFWFKMFSAAGMDRFFCLWVVVALGALFLSQGTTLFAEGFLGKSKELERGSLKSKIVSVAKGLGFPLDRVFLADHTEISPTRTVHHTGIRKKRLVIYSTLSKEETEDTIVACAVHEIAHWKYSHKWKQLAAHLATMLVLIMFAGKMLSGTSVVKALLFGENVAEHIAPHIRLAYLFLFFTHARLLLSMLQGVLARQFEKEADLFVVSNGHGQALLKYLRNLCRKGKTNPNPDTLYSVMNYSLPPPAERIRVMSEAITKTETKIK
jgi:STE24 endopeptidase